MTSRFLIVELGETPPNARRWRLERGYAVFRGVVAITDAEIISRATLDEWLLPPDQNYQTIRTRRPRKKKTP